MSRTVRTVPPKPGWMPSRTSGNPRDSSRHRRRLDSRRRAQVPARRPARSHEGQRRWGRADPRAIEHGLPGAHQFVSVLRRANLQEFLDVGARDETIGFGGAQPPHRPPASRSDLGQRGREILEDGCGQNVGRKVPGVSHASQAMRSASTSKVQLLICVMAYAALSACSWIVKSQINGK